MYIYILYHSDESMLMNVLSELLGTLNLILHKPRILLLQPCSDLQVLNVAHKQRSPSVATEFGRTDTCYSNDSSCRL